MKSISEKFLNLVAEFIATCCYVGYVPYAPGTVASVVAAAVLFCLPEVSAFYISFIIFGLFCVGVPAAFRVAKNSGTHDPGTVVIDEWIGMWIALLLLPKTVAHYAIAILLFRFFDIIKPYPISRMEQLPRGFGIILDDVLAGFFTFLCLQIIKCYF